MHMVFCGYICIIMVSVLIGDGGTVAFSVTIHWTTILFRIDSISKSLVRGMVAITDVTESLRVAACMIQLKGRKQTQNSDGLRR